MIKFFYLLISMLLAYILIRSKKHFNLMSKKRFLLDKIDNSRYFSNQKKMTKYLNYKFNNLLIVTQFIIAILAMFLFYAITNVFSTSIVIGIILFFIPNIIFEFKVSNKKNKILQEFPNYIINLKSYTNTSNDIIVAMKNAKVQEVLRMPIENFNVSIQKGLNTYESFENLKKEINITKISQYISLIEFCHEKGGNFTELLNKIANIMVKTNLQKEKERQNLLSAKFALIFLVLINLFVLFYFVFSNKEYSVIIQNNFIGNIILNFNVISYIVIIYIYMQLNRGEE